MFVLWYHPFLLMAVRVCYISSAIYIDKSSMGLASVPQNISIQVTSLNLNHNRIIRITNKSFAMFKELHTLKLVRNGLTYIENGSFDHNAKLEKISAAVNNIIQLPHSFGAAATSLRHLHLWCALRDPAVHKINFTEMINLNWLNIGCSNLHGVFDASRLPRNLGNTCLNYGRLTQFPDFARHTPNIATIMTAGNAITEVPSDYIIGNTALKQLNLNNNKLSTIPDLYHLPLEGLTLYENHIVCNQSLCWIRMWPWMRTPTDITDDITCATPASLQGVLLMAINPITLGCHNGACYYWQKVYRKLGNINWRNIYHHNLNLVARSILYICDIDKKWMDKICVELQHTHTHLFELLLTNKWHFIIFYLFM